MRAQFAVFIFVIFIAMSVSVSHGGESAKWREFEVGPYKLLSPLPPQEIKTQGVDSWVGRFRVGEHIELNFDAGMFSSDFSEFKSYRAYKRYRAHVEGFDYQYVYAERDGTIYYGLYTEKNKGKYRYNLLARCGTRTELGTAKKIIESARVVK